MTGLSTKLAALQDAGKPIQIGSIGAGDIGSMWYALHFATKFWKEPDRKPIVPEAVWDYYGFTKEQPASGDSNPHIFNSFVDGTTSALKMAAVANGCGLIPPSTGLAFPPCGTHDLPRVLKPRSAGGQAEEKEAPDKCQRKCFPQYGIKTDDSILVASIMVRGESTGQTRTWAGDIVATAKRDLKKSEKLDGEGGFMVYGKLMRAEDPLQGKM
ncbi:hypothetical protein P171DRAFT_523707 [Karstenula rhodostoma CBS 690.94]|uniref:Oxidoreductase DRL-like catalytic domain-containing protein n=1 Tax=Karstenula rhodostoma CBS 690.94 TaxID=1392251 RepID=A0A9P4UA62_9PLEO|nr:hypothetical protein P171DRAFT_523707 [Karstenula rhodostoma CBS 690.94]